MHDTNQPRSLFSFGVRTRPWTNGRTARAVAVAVLVLPTVSFAQTPALVPFEATPRCARVIDPKLADVVVPIRIDLRGAVREVDLTVQLRKQGTTIATLFTNRQVLADHVQFEWNGRLPTPSAPYVDPGNYEIAVDAVDVATGRLVKPRSPLAVVRLGITEIASQGWYPNSEWQMVYFKRGTVASQFYATPAMGEYRNIADTGQLADLDLNNGAPRSSVPIHNGTASPPMEGTVYEDDRFNFPLCYRVSTRPLFTARFGSTAIATNGQAVATNVPVPGVRLRCVALSDLGPWQSFTHDLAPGGTASLLGPTLPADVRAIEFTMFWSFQSSVDAGASWQTVPGRICTDHRIYTVLGTPRFGGTSGAQHSGPWVEAMAKLETWRRALGVDTSTEAGVAQVLTKGFGGQVPGIPQPIENVRYDTNILGGDGGASHYYTGSAAIALSKLFDNAANGLFVNCSDCASALAAMMGMAGFQGVQLDRLGPMDLRAIRGIGAPNYTLALWGTAHSFSYHHVVTRSAGTSICDACLWVDEDGAPGALPGTPGFNVDRPWSGSATSYQSLVALAPITFVLESLPTLQ